MSARPAAVGATIVNLYYAELDRAVRFWRDGLGFPVEVDQEWALLLRLATGSFLGLVDGSRGHLRPQPASAVLVTLVVDDLSRWRERVGAAGAAGMTEIERREDLGIERFFCRDPGGYALEVQRFLRPAERAIFHRGAASTRGSPSEHQEETNMFTKVLMDRLRDLGGEVEERGGGIEFTKVLAERRVFLARKKLVYRARLRVDAGARAVHLSESLTETSSGLAPESGFGFKTETYKTRAGPREGDIAERAKLFGKAYTYTFDHGAVRKAIEALAQEHGYTVQYHVTGP